MESYSVHFDIERNTFKKCAQKVAFDTEKLRTRSLFNDKQFFLGTALCIVFLNETACLAVAYQLPMLILYDTIPSENL